MKRQFHLIFFLFVCFPCLRVPAQSGAELKPLTADPTVFQAAPPSKAGQAASGLQNQMELEQQYRMLQFDLTRKERFKGLADQTFKQEALILEADRDPADVVLRRTSALLTDLQKRPQAPDLSAETQELATLEKIGKELDPGKTRERFELFVKACVLRRKIAFSNPLLDFKELLFIKRHRSTFNHMCDQYYGVNTPAGGGLYALTDPFGPEPRLRDVLANSKVERGRLQGQQLNEGSFLSPDLSYDGKTILFAYVECKGDTQHILHTDPSRGHWEKQRCYHVFRVETDGTGLQQLTDGTWNEFDPCWLPNGRVVFISERRGGYLRCGRECPLYTLYDMNPDGSDLLMMSPHESNEWNPSVTHDGMIVYTRWDYVDRHGCVAHHPWLTTPDGRNARSIHGNFSARASRADMELDIRAIPESNRFVATATPHHGQAFGSLVMFDPRVEDDDAMAPVKRLTPEVEFPESQGGSQVYGTAWPLSENYYLCVYDPTMEAGSGQQGGENLRGNYGIYLVDAFGNKELIYRDPEISSTNPMPLRARTQPPVLPSASERLNPEKPTTGTMAVLNVYDSLKNWPADTKIKSLRIFQIFPISVPSGYPPHEVGMRLPGDEGADSVILARSVLGTVPVEEDGSAHFTVPALKEIYFQALDEKGLAVQSMRSAAYLQPGERLVCQGCHEPKYRTPVPKGPLAQALRRQPSEPKSEGDGTAPISYPLLVQPVLEKNCLECHQKNPDKAPRLDREVIANGKSIWYASYWSLAPKFGFWQYGNPHRTVPGEFGARKSKLYEMLTKGHHEVKLSPEDLRRITLWLDACSIFYGVYEKEGGEQELRGEVAKPTLE